MRLRHWSWEDDLPTFIRIVVSHALLGAAIGLLPAVLNLVIRLSVGE
jgi:hypothetical protein